MSMNPIIVIDDLRSFKEHVVAELSDARLIHYARTSHDALVTLGNFHREGLRVNQLWLDHDLGGDDTIMPVIAWLCMKSTEDTPLDVDLVLVHTSNPSGADAMVRSLRNYHYPTKRVLAEDYFTT